MLAAINSNSFLPGVGPAPTGGTETGGIRTASPPFKRVSGFARPPFTRT